MAEAGQGAGDRVDSNETARTSPTVGAAATGDITETGGLSTPATGAGMQGRAPGGNAPDLTGAAVPPDLSASIAGDAQDPVTQVDGTYDANAGGTGVTGSTATPNTLGGVGGSLGGLSDRR